ncbi:MAG: sterol-binding protein [Stappia sp.]|nr:sterol-binding protein [Stappia sp.]
MTFPSADTRPARHIPEVPPFLALGLRLAPPGPAGRVLSEVARRILADHPRLIDRLGAYRPCRFSLTATDVPINFLIDLGADPVRVRLQATPPDADARISGKLAALIGLVHGAWDGDALFFSRDLVVEGDTSAALALRNAIDDAELDLGQEISSLSGPLSGLVSRLISFTEGLTGVPLTRTEAIQ